MTGADVLPDGLVATSGDRLDYVGPATGYDGAVPPPSEQLILPGLVDVHNHGGGGVSFPDATTPEEVQAAVRPHLLAGTTSLIASLVTAAPQTLLARAELLAGQCEAGVLAGIHAEGP
ncbi:MAG: amidohydrolase family protein, partial [Promicromonosporaceae bacterium]|nr:amidohydrolase family protein [Promicromonosporaceae bacterium]